MGPKSFLDYLDSDKTLEPTPSLKNISLVNLISTFPIWFYIACPDVMHWVHEKQREAYFKQKLEEFFIKLPILLKFAESDDFQNLDNERIYFNKQFLPKYLKNLIASYKEETGLDLECSN